LLLDVSQAGQVGVADHRHHQATRAAHGHADVEVTVVNDVGAIDRGVDDGNCPKRNVESIGTAVG
jgi:hypothetical protein